MSDMFECIQCGAVFDDDSDVDPERPNPCRICGSTARRFWLQAEPGRYSIEGSPAPFTLVRNAASLLLQAPGGRFDDKRGRLAVVNGALGLFLQPERMKCALDFPGKKSDTGR